MGHEKEGYEDRAAEQSRVPADQVPEQPHPATANSSPQSLLGLSPCPAPDLECYTGEYLSHGFHLINLDTPGLQCIHNTPPFLFLVHDLFSKEECEAIIGKATPHLQRSKYMMNSERSIVDAGRTSDEVRFHWDECSGLQRKLSRVLNMGMESLEPPKVIRYQRGQKFKKHTDAQGMTNHQPVGPYTAPYGTRTASLIIYLNDVPNGGATVFTRLNIKVKPKRGMGLLHFPAYLPSAKVGARGSCDDSTEHMGATALSEKWVMTQFGAPCPLRRTWYEKRGVHRLCATDL